MCIKLTIQGSILFIFWLVLTFLIILIAIAWGNGINGQFYGLIEKAAAEGQEGFTTNFSIALKEFAFTIKDYGTVALTFFGITFIGGIFDLNRRAKTEKEKLSRYWTLIIFVISIMFLLCFISLYLLYSLIYPYILTNEDTIFLLLNVGLSLFIITIDILLFVLLFYFARVSLLSQQIITDK